MVKIDVNRATALKIRPINENSCIQVLIQKVFDLSNQKMNVKKPINKFP